MEGIEPDTDLRHELDSEGRDAGVEYEQYEEDEEDAIRDPFDPQLIDVTTEVRTLDTLMKRLHIGQIDLDPDFQRSRGIWTDQKKSQLIESLLLRIPLPTFYVAELPNGGGLGDDLWAVVDGIQRLSTIAQFVAPDALQLEPLRLHGLEYLQRENGKVFAELSSALQLRILESQFTIQVIRKTTPEAVKLNIFARINTGGVPLSRQELRHALIPGRARHVLRDLAASEEFQQAVDYSVNPTRMADREMVLRFLAFRIEDPLTYRNRDFDRFLRDTMRIVNSWDDGTLALYREQFSLAMRTSTQIFGQDAFRKRYSAGERRRPVSKALFEAVSVAGAAAADRIGPDSLRAFSDNAALVRQRFMELMHDPVFDRAISQGTGDVGKIQYRFAKLIDLMNNAAGGDAP
jgi:hypothetical protein